MTPLPLVLSGLVLALFGGALGVMGLTSETPGVMLVGWGVSGLAGLLLFVGLVSLGVEIGVRAADR